MDDEDEKMYSEKTLQLLSYRLLQKMAKSMRLPSNVKKVCLIKLIRAKKFCSESELDEIVQKVKAERKQFSKKRQVNSKETSEKTDVRNESLSPMIASTPKRKCFKKRFQLENFETFDEYKSKQQNKTNLTSNKTLSSKNSTNGSDRILRSFNLKKLSNSDHDDDDFCSTNTHYTSNKKDVTEVIVQRQQPVLKYMMPNRFIKRPERNMLVSNDLLMHRSDRKRRYRTVCMRDQITPPIRPRTVKWIYPLWPDVKPNKNSIFVKGLNFRQSNGKISKIQALIHKRDNSNVQRFSYCDVDTNTDPVMEIFLPNDDHNYVNDRPFYINQHKKIADGNSELDKNYEFFDTDSLYYNDIDGELACCKELTTSELEDTCRFPNTDEAFTEIKNSDVTQPLFVETSGEGRKFNDFTSNNSDMDRLDNLYLLNNNYDLNEPLLKFAMETNSYSSYNTSEQSSVLVDETSDVDVEDVTHIKTDLLDDINEGEQTDDTMSELFKFSQIMSSYATQYEDHYTSMSSSETSQESEENVNVQEMVEDAIDIIRKDGVYLEGIGNDVRVQCIFCSWAGPQNLIENHVKNEHSDKINKSHNNECTIKFNLGHLVQSQLWLSEVIEHSSILYALCVKYEDPDYLMATVATLNSDSLKGQKGKIIIYNKVTGEPYIWEGPMQPLSSNMPHFNTLEGLNLKLSTLNLIPNSANLKLVNRELVNDSPTKVVVGQPELNGIHIELLISIM